MTRLHNGTFNAVKRILLSLVQRTDFELFVICDGEAAEFHRLAELLPEVTILEPSTVFGFDAMLRIGQPFSFLSYEFASQRALHVFYMMLDTIAWDCQSLRYQELDLLWKQVATTADGLLFNSKFSMDRFINRFQRDGLRPCVVGGHSMVASDYASEHLNALSTDASQRYDFLVFGNDHDHKFVRPTLEKLSGAFPEKRFFAVGLRKSRWANVTSLRSGHLEDREIEELILNCGAIIYPSQYEGFGFPIAEGLSRGKRIFARESQLNRDFLNTWSEPMDLRLYSSTLELIEMIKTQDEAKTLTAPRENARFDWNSAATQSIDFVRQISSAEDSLRITRARLNAIELAVFGRRGFTMTPMAAIRAIMPKPMFKALRPVWLFAKNLYLRFTP